MTLSNYEWLDAEQTMMRAVDSELGSVAFAALKGMPYYREFLESGQEAAPYVAPPEPTPLTAQQKLENAGLTVDELKTLLGI